MLIELKYLHFQKLTFNISTTWSWKKKDREIKLIQWQEDIIDPKMLTKGLIISNGTIYRNEETKEINIKFYNRSSDIVDIFEKYISKLNFVYRRFRN